MQTYFDVTAHDQDHKTDLSPPSSHPPILFQSAALRSDQPTMRARYRERDLFRQASGLCDARPPRRAGQLPAAKSQTASDFQFLNRLLKNRDWLGPKSKTT